jgi:thiamine kinase-like enzyme
VFSNHETILSLYESESHQPSPHLKKILLQSFEIYMDLIEKDGTRPCVPLHGDFWHNNILLDDDHTVSLIDFSRIPYGEA